MSSPLPLHCVKRNCAKKDIKLRANVGLEMYISFNVDAFICNFFIMNNNNVYRLKRTILLWENNIPNVLYTSDYYNYMQMLLYIQKGMHVRRSLQSSNFFRCLRIIGRTFKKTNKKLK